MGKYDALTKEELVRLLEARDRREATRFGLVWEAGAEPEAGLNADYVALDLVPELSHGPGPWENLVIEGDNFDALRALRPGFSGKFRLLATDPPYNTGNRDFLYNDRFLDKEDLWRHSKWLEFMSQRLSLARDLLAENAAAFIHIDDNEIFQLGLLMNKIFGEKNFVANVIWQKRYSVPSDHKSIAALHEYLLVYQASSLWQRRFLPRGVEKDKQYRFEDENGVFRPDNYTCNKSAEERPNLYYAITNPNTGDEIWPKTTAVWRYSKETHEENVRKNLVYWGKDGKGKVPAFKRYRHRLRNAEGVVPHTWWGFDEVGHNDEAKKELMAILPEMARAFSTPKPTRLLDRILQIGCDETGWVLDMFAGSGTTGHAVMKANAAGKGEGKRRYVLISNTEAR